ncbi:thioredoxin domain-containing protein [Alteribacillus sp. HJP-4]|uniref:thioredoxin domain-containing protein n=1 Tax=Alteribacillus sp. HJP-4 TaxID=2775394 RepID=UPI0035CCE782
MQTRFVLIVIVFITTAVTAGCTASATPSLIKDINEDKAFLLFSNDEDLLMDQPYYNALLQAVNECREKIGVEIVSSEESAIVDYLQVKEFPTLFLVENQQTTEKYTGTGEKEDISAFIAENVSCEVD